MNSNEMKDTINRLKSLETESAAALAGELARAGVFHDIDEPDDLDKAETLNPIFSAAFNTGIYKRAAAISEDFAHTILARAIDGFRIELERIESL